MCAWFLFQDTSIIPFPPYSYIDTLHGIVCFVKSWRKASRHCNSEYGQIQPRDRYIYSFSIDIFVRNAICQGAVMVVIVWCLDLQLPAQSVSITINVVSSNPVHGEVYSMEYYVIKFVSAFLRALRYPPSIKLTSMI